jgi:4-hydroxybenzoate polyprenyltransferase
MLDFLCVLFIVTFQKGFYSAGLVGLAVLTVSLITAGGAAINDCFDCDSDALTHPERPVASGKISPAGAAQFSALMFLAGLGTSFVINSVAFGIVAVNVVLFIMYPRVIKRFSGFLSNLVMGYLGATIALFAGAVVFQTINVDSLSFVGLIAGGAIGLNVLKDILTLEGDPKLGYFTLAAKRGVRVAVIVGALFLLVSAATSPFPKLEIPTAPSAILLRSQRISIEWDIGCDESASGKSRKVSPSPENAPLSERSSSGGAAPRGAATFVIGAR